ncbi:nicotinate-nucleotide pyrophosphorylase NadC [Peptoclostridium acidaminophilum DSM 3953]|uniref:Probable nicotinate-nucleotide pyrophosphorylase [carboxylating] n=1 Tax=Peptoclostridium acidaminophilum DSM 3953 TaxID=1286171 RepID=W8TC52_PEPAC|nr:carboxylating nicotinate-nucleotide diphosphorylase [Peptoclostridium acidaminophilum]AHM55388.1 nicotinate-nucleotide pyrophosphorylase NadC [Peptoclostridium acidaminophilum DSM 3953]
MDKLNMIMVERLIKAAIEEDINYFDITTDNLIGEQQVSEAIMLAKEDGVICGMGIAARVFGILDENVVFEKLKQDGDKVCRGDIIARISGSTRAILKGERTALNIVQRLSGIATKTYGFAEKVKGYDVKIVDTRKTTPTLRFLEKYAVRCGGGYNHRYNLSHSVMLKDNHIDACGGIKQAVEMIKRKIGHTEKIEVEVRNLEEMREALEACADIIMLDNMGTDDMKAAVDLNKAAARRAVIEASGNVDESNVAAYAATGVDVISVGGLTHSFKSLDISLKL